MPAWTCPKCDERVEASFEICWNCGTSHDGQEDPDFLPADLADPIPNSPDYIGAEPARMILADASEVDSGEEFAGTAPVDLVECYWARDHVEAQFLVDQLVQRGIPAVADGDMMRQGLGAAAFNVPYFAPRVRVRAEDLPRARAWLEAYERRPRRDPTDDD